MKRILHCFRESLQKYPVPVNMAVYGTFYTAAEMSQQTFKKMIQLSDEEFDFTAAMKIAAVGSSIYAPSLYYWYRLLDLKMPGTNMKFVATKVLLDQIIITPILIATFYTTFGIIDRKEDVFEELREKFWKTFIANQMFWVPAQSINFALVSPRFRVIYVATVSFLWINVLCIIKREKYIFKDDTVKEVNEKSE